MAAAPSHRSGRAGGGSEAAVEVSLGEASVGVLR